MTKVVCSDCEHVMWEDEDYCVFECENCGRDDCLGEIPDEQ